MILRVNPPSPSISSSWISEGESDVTGNIIDELHSWDIQGDQIKGESGIILSIIDELHSSFIQLDQMEGENSVTRSIIDENLFSDIQGYQM